MEARFPRGQRLAAADAKPLLSHVRWIGGGSGAGKSTLTKHIVEARGAAVYDTDAAMAQHAERCSPSRCPQLSKFQRMSMDERWVNRSPKIMFETFHWYRGEAFDLIVDDLIALPDHQPVLAEGFRLLPHLVAPLLADRRHAAWLLPTSAFRRKALDARGTTWDIPRRTSDPERAFANILARDALFTERIRREAADLDLFTVDVDGSLDENDLAALLTTMLFSHD